jgi:hypothetical protein
VASASSSVRAINDSVTYGRTIVIRERTDSSAVAMPSFRRSASRRSRFSRHEPGHGRAVPSCVLTFCGFTS